MLKRCFPYFVPALNQFVMLLAILLPGLSLWRHRRPGRGLLCLLLQLTLLGWPLGAYLALRNRKYQRRRRRAGHPEWAKLTRG